MDAGLGLGLLADLYDISGEKIWLQADWGWPKDWSLAILMRCYRVVLPVLTVRVADGSILSAARFGAHSPILARDRDQCLLDADYTAR